MMLEKFCITDDSIQIGMTMILREKVTNHMHDVIWSTEIIIDYSDCTADNVPTSLR